MGQFTLLDELLLHDRVDRVMVRPDPRVFIVQGDGADVLRAGGRETGEDDTVRQILDADRQVHGSAGILELFQVFP